MKTEITVKASEYSVANKAIMSLKDFFELEDLAVKGPYKIKGAYGPRPTSVAGPRGKQEIVRLARMRIVIEGHVSAEAMDKLDRMALPSTCQLEFKIEA